MTGNNKPHRVAIPRPPRRRFAARSLRVYARSLPVVDEVSAGGLVVKVEDGRPYVAIIARRNRTGNIEWCLPKGHVEFGETTQTTAIREIAEETGILGRIVAPLASIDYWFSSRDRRVHKVVHHFLLEYVQGEVTVENDPDHEAEDAQWFLLSEVSRILAHPNERRIVSIALDLLYPDSGGRRS